MDRPADLIRTNIACKILDVAPCVVRRWIRTGKLPAWRVGGRWRVSRSDCEAAWKSLRVGAGLPKRNAAEVVTAKERRQAAVMAALKTRGIG